MILEYKEQGLAEREAREVNSKVGRKKLDEAKWST